MNSSAPVASVTEQPVAGYVEAPKERDAAMARLMRFIGLPDLAELYEPRPGRFVADRIHRHGQHD